MNVKMINSTKEEEIRKRVEDNLGLIYRPVQRFYNSSEMIRVKYDFDELISVGTLALHKASTKFDKTKGFKFSTYAVPLIRYALIEFTRKDKWHYDRRNVNGVDSFIPVDRISLSSSMKSRTKPKDNATLTLVETLVDKEEVFDNANNKIIVDNLLSTCSKREEGILRGYFFDEKSQTELAKKFNTSQSYVSLVIKRNLTKFKKILIKEGFEEC